MKQCEKYYEKNIMGKDGDTLDYHSGLGCGWREALLWFYKVAEHLSPTDCDLIDKELEDETSQDSI